MLNEIPIEDQYVFTSLRYDGSMKRNSQNPGCCPDSKAAYLMKYHYDRLATAADHLGWYDTMKVNIKGPVDLFNRIQTKVLDHKKQTGNKCPFKVRVCVRHNGKVEIGIEPIMATKQPLLFPTTLDLDKQSQEAASQTPIFKAVLDVLPTRTTTFTREKTHYRTMYNYARHCAGIQSYQDAKEVILFNRDNQIMDGSITTPYFYRNGKWMTPHKECGGQQGTTRRWALDNGLCQAGIIDVATLKHDEIIWLSNGVKGFFTARFVACNDRLARTPSYESRMSRSDSPTEEKHHEDEVAEDDIEPQRRKYAPEPGSEVFRKEAFSLDVFERALKL